MNKIYRLTNNQRRYVILFANTLATFSIGSIYAWSVFTGPLETKFGWSGTQLSLAFALLNLIFPFMMIGGNILQKRFDINKLFLIGGIGAGVSTFLTSFSHSLAWLYLTYSICSGIFIFLIYSCTMTNVVRLFPDKTGFAWGLTAAGYGFSSVALAPILQSIISELSVMTAFRFLGIWYILLVGIAWFIIVKVPAHPPITTDAEAGNYSCEKSSLAYSKYDQVAPDTEESSTTTSNEKQTDDNTNFVPVWKDIRLYLITAIMLLCSTAGLMVLSQASVMAQTITGTTPALAAIAVSLISLNNTGGRVLWGWFSDKIGCYTVLYILFATLGTALFLLTHVSIGDFLFFLILTMLVGLCYGGFMGVIPTLVSIAFGPKNVSGNYGIVLFGCSAGTFLGAPTAAAFADAGTGSGVYFIPFIIGGSLCVLGLFVVLYTKKITEKKAEA